MTNVTVRSLHTRSLTEVMIPRSKLLRCLVSTLALLPAWQADAGQEHWAFKPLAESDGSQPSTTAGGPRSSGIDAFIDAKLAGKDLHRSPPADPVTWLRRVTLDLTGLPPTPDEVDAFAKNPDRAAVVDRLLASPRYGEHWAQHWLDVVRYADTHGFEVNTERPNAWPYRDYVIRSFNNDTPYDRFIKEQLVGDAMGEDAATGFLVTASVLLPGQIGKDEPSKRLARQDSLDEIVVNIGQTFLGLSVGCARCHDHKFDPISQRDYYSMQAFVSGVEYADRPMRTKEMAVREQELASLRKRVAEIEDQLAQFVPLAHPGGPARPTDARQNIETFAPLEAKFVRFTIHDANLHPKLGLIEPCIDEFEIYAGDENLARSAKVTASGSRTSASHQLQHINDGQYGNARSWMSDAKGRGWVEFELPQPARITKIIWGRDRLGKFTDRLATAYTLQAGLSRDSMQNLAEVRPPRPTVNWKLTTDRFAPVKAKRLRFTVLATNGLEPCIDEIEVFDTHGKNLARAAKVTTSGNLIVPDRHDPDYLNDGNYGNERSWLGNESGKGWVELAFDTEHEISRVLWSRDREGVLQDRMPTEYRIEVAQRDDWKLVADSSDRRPFIAGTAIDPEFTISGLPPDEEKAAQQLLDQKQKLEAGIRAAEQGQLAFAGKFRQPDEIHLLTRGDPEQPKEQVTPAVLGALGTLKMGNDAPEQQRRQALADWIASPRNPLTARVMVNRLWQGHFGTGLVSTPSDFGISGSKPSHPELLDWLAQEFIRSGWSVKHMHRLIVLSGTYSQASRSGDSPSPSAVANRRSLEIDADDRLLWCFPSRRLEAECIHDAMLAVSGRLNLTMYGRGYDLFDKRGGLSGFKPVETFTPDNERRMIYAHKVRRESEAVFGAFDCPDAGQSTAVRRTSTTPIQALNLFNSQFTLAHCDAFAQRVKKQAGEDLSQQIRRAYLLALSRVPTSDEIHDAEPVVRGHGLAVLCRALFNSNEFLFLP